VEGDKWVDRDVDVLGLFIGKDNGGDWFISAAGKVKGEI
jgi:hypothetical protein